MSPFFTMVSFFFLLVWPCVLSFSPPNPVGSRSHCSRSTYTHSHSDGRDNNNNKNHNHRRWTSSLFGLAEWRDLDMGFPGTGDDINRRMGSEQGGLPKSLCILPFHYTDVLLQGETKQLRLYEERFIELFKDAMDNHCGVVAMGLIADSGIIQTVPICEIEAYNRMEDFGIFVTIRVVARAQLLEITKQEPYIKAACLEINDKVPPNLEFPNLVASNIENFMLVLSSMEHRLAKAKQERGENGANDEEEDEEESEMQRRINIAKLEDRFYQNSDEDDDYDDDDTDIDDIFDRRKRFRQSYEVAMATDTQGYCVSSSSKEGASDRTPQELTALSWASFCTELLPEEDTTFKIQALDCDDLFERLKLASQMLRAKQDDLRVKMKKAGINFREEDESQ